MACGKSNTGALRCNRAIRVSAALARLWKTKFSQTGRGATRGLSTGNRHARYGKHRIVYGWCGSHNPDWAKTRGRIKLATDLSLDKEILKTHAYASEVDVD
jgi:hypothetical protein